MEETQTNKSSWPVGYLFLAWLAVLAGVMGSLYYSEIARYVPCVLCWWARIFMYPLAILLPIGIARRDFKIYLYILPLAVLGLLTTLYHNLLYFQVLPERVAPCQNGVSCLGVNVQLFGFMDIPLMAFLGFLFITVVLIIFRHKVIKLNENE